MSKLKIVVLYDRVLVPDGDEPAPGEKAPVVRSLDRKEVEEEVAEALARLGHEPVLYEIDGTTKSLLGLARMDCDLVFNLAESFADDDTAEFRIAALLELLGKKYTGSGSHGLLLAQDKAVAKKIFAFHGIHTPVFAQQTAIAACQALELRDYGRVDMRLQADGRVHVIEVNPNPWLSSRAEFAMAARKAGRTYVQLVEEIVELALARD